jgi:hypothetical protein
MATMTPFQKAFNEAKRGGQKTFPFNGKTYSTKTAEEQGREIGAKASGSGRGMAAGRTASDKGTSSGRAEIPKSDAKAPSASTERRMSPLEMGLLTTSGALAAPLAVRGVMKTAPKVAGMASKAGEAAKGAASKAGEAVKGAASKASEAVKGAASKAGEAVKGAMERRAAAKAAPERKEPSSLYPDPPKTGGVFRSARPPAPKPTPAPKPKAESAPKPKAESAPPPAPSPLPKSMAESRPFRSRTADRADERMADFKKGGMTKGGGGCETRGKKARYV